MIPKLQTNLPVQKEQHWYNITASWCSSAVGKGLRLMGCFWMSSLMNSNVSLGTQKRFLNLLSSQLIIPSIQHDLFCILRVGSLFLCLKQDSCSWYNNTNEFFYIIIFLFLRYIHFIYVLLMLFYISPKDLENHWCNKD